MAASKFWRASETSLTYFDGVPADTQKLEPRLFNRLAIGQGIVVGDFSDYNSCGEINWVGVIEEVSIPDSTVKVNWRNADFTLKPTASGVGYWRKYDWFNFSPDVVNRYLLDAIFADIFEEENWARTVKRAPLIRAEKRESAPIEQQLNSSSTALPGLPAVRSSSNPTVGYVYLIWSQYGYKIGKAVNVQSRTKLFEVKLPFPIRVEHYAKFDDYTQAERTLHLHFNEKRMEGEWFSLNDEDVAFIKTLGEPQPTQGL